MSELKKYREILSQAKPVNSGSGSWPDSQMLFSKMLHIYESNIDRNQQLKEKANDVNSYCCLGASHTCPLNVNDGFCVADTCQYKVKQLLVTVPKRQL